MADDPAALEALHARVTELEVKSAYQDDLLHKLDEVLREFAGRTEATEARLRELEQRLKEAEAGGPEMGPHDEKPPHY